MLALTGEFVPIPITDEDPALWHETLEVRGDLAKSLLYVCTKVVRIWKSVETGRGLDWPALELVARTGV
jgi:cation-transporting P-type ATPase 13A2